MWYLTMVIMKISSSNEIIALLVKNPPAMQETPVQYSGEGIGYSLQYSWASLVAQLVKNPLQCGRPGLERSPGEGEGYPLQYSGLESSTDYIVHGVAKSWTQLSDFHQKKKKKG